MAGAPIRRAGVDDAEIIARLHVAAWRESYAALVPREALAAMDVSDRAARWRDIFHAQEDDGASAVFLAMSEDDEPKGFAACGRQRVERVEAAGFAGEFTAIYLLGRAQRRGLGRALMGVMAKHLIAKGLSSASVWVFRDNPDARRFYEALGGEETGIDGEWSVLGVTLPDMSYGWRDLSKLVAHQ
jgi:GNAT superfamily N-acetyltransferase